MSTLGREVVSVPVSRFEELAVGEYFVRIGPNKIVFGELYIKLRGETKNAMRKSLGFPALDFSPGELVVRLS